MRALSVAALVCLLAGLAQATSSVTGTVVDLSGNPITSRTFVRFSLKGCNGNIPRVTATGSIAQPYIDATPNGSGNLSLTLYKTSEIDCGGQTSVTTYDYEVWRDGRKLYTYNFTIDSASFNVNSATPNSVTPTIAAPTGDSTYLRLDGGNQMSGSIVPSATNTYNSGASSARWATGYFVAGNFSGTLTGAGANFTSIGATTPGTGVFTTLNSTGGALNGTVGATTPTTGAFTTVNASTSVTTASIVSSAASGTTMAFSSKQTIFTGAVGNSGADGGGFAFTTGNGSSTHPAGTFSITGGTGGTSVPANGGAFSFTGGNGAVGGGGFTVVGGDGTGAGAGVAAGGAISLTAGNATAGNNSGGNITFTPGNKSGSGTQGAVLINGLVSTYNSIALTGNGIPSEVAAVNLTAQTAAVTTATLYAVPAAGQYRLSWNAKITTAAGTSSTLGALTIVYTDPDGVAVTITAPASIAAGTIATTSAANTTGTVLLGLPLLLNCKASTNITYAFAYASNAAAAMNYNLHLVLESH